LMDWLRKHAPLARLIATVITAVGLSVLIASLIVSGKEAAELRSCHRLNVKRAIDNGNFKAIYLAFIQADSDAPGLMLKARANSMQWVPLTNCPQVVYTDRQPP